MKKFKAVLFDLDGTIAKTMKAYFIVWQKACKDFGFEIFESDYYPLEGMEANEIARTLCKNREGNESNIEKIVERKKNYFLEMFSSQKAELYSGVETVLDMLVARNVPLALVTASVSEQVKASISPEILKKFKVVVTGEMGGRGKPFPDPYFLGAKLLGVSPEYCIGIENAPLGVRSVKSAEMYSVGLAHTVSAEKLKEADVVLSSFEELPKFFEDIGI